MNKTRNLIILLLFPVLLQAQAPLIQWEKNFGGSLLDGASDVLKVADGYIVSGYSESNDADFTSNYGGFDAWLFKLDNSGVLQWKKNYGGSADDYFLSIKQTTDGGYILGGQSSSNDIDVSGNNGGSDYWIVKTDSLGVIQWQDSYGGSSNEELTSIQQTNDGGYIASGATRSNNGDVAGYHPGGLFGDDFWVIKLDNLGVLQWQNCLGGSGEDYGYEIKQTSDGGYIAAGVTTSLDGDVTFNNGGDDYWVIKMNALGAIQWQKCYGGANFELANYILETYDGGYIIAGQAGSSNADVTANYGGKDCWIVKIDSLGLIQWQKNYGGTGNEIAFSVVQNSDSSYVVLSNTNSNNIDVSGNHGNKDIWLFKLSPSGTLLWQKCYGGSQADEAFFGLRPTPDGGYVIAGYSQSNDMDVSGNYGNMDCWVLKLSFSVGIFERQDLQVVSIYPNPSSGKFSFFNSEGGNTIEIYDAIGKQIMRKVNSNGQEIIDISGNAKGVYFYRIINENELIQQGKIVLD